MQPAISTPLVQFHRLIPQARLPQRADRTALGTLPTRAAQYCDAVTQASAFGYYLFTPIDLSLLWDGADIFWSHADSARWLALDAAQLPSVSQYFDSQAPTELAGCVPPLLTALPEPGHVQIWTGLFARTAPEWNLLLRPVANLPSPGGYVAYEGIIETDRWFGPLFANLRLTRTDRPIKLSSQFPLVQAQPLPHALTSNETLARMATTDAMSADDWQDYHRSIVAPNERPDRPFGGYAMAARKRRRCPMETMPLSMMER